jgi:hypothetical protein
MDPLHARNSVALSAFLLTTLPDNLARKKLVQEIWESGANTIVRAVYGTSFFFWPLKMTSNKILIDHNSKRGFDAIAGAREFLLELGRKDVLRGEESDTSSHLAGSHVVAPVSDTSQLCTPNALVDHPSSVLMTVRARCISRAR